MKLGIAGIGRIAQDYIELICTGRVPGMAVGALSSRNAGHMEALQRQYPALAQVPCFADYGEMLRSGSIDAVLICTPHAQHPEMARQALAAGLHTLVEKPVGIDRAALRGVETLLAEKPELVCGVMYVRRMSKAYGAIRRLMAEGTIGELVRATWLITNLYRTDAYYASGSWRGTWAGEGGGLLMTQASHQLDLLQWLCGMPASVLARCSTVDRPLQVENEAELFLTYPNGARGHFIASAHESPGTNRLELCGTKGRIVAEDDRTVTVTRLAQDEREHARTCPDPFAKVPSAEEVFTFDDADNKVQQAAMLADFAAAVQEKRLPACPFADGLRSLEIIRGAYLSSWLKQEVSLPCNEAEFDAQYQAHL